MKQATKAEPKMWGSSLIGFGSKPLKYESGREIDWMLTAFLPRKSYHHSLYPGWVWETGRLAKETGETLHRQSLFIHQEISGRR
jgi:hypothetical protein